MTLFAVTKLQLHDDELVLRKFQNFHQHKTCNHEFKIHTRLVFLKLWCNSFIIIILTIGAYCENIC